MIDNYYDINKVIMHQILVKYKFYQLKIPNLVELLILLEMPILELSPTTIQENIFIGLIRLAEKNMYNFYDLLGSQLH